MNMNGNENQSGSPFGAPPKPEINVRTEASDAASIARGEPMPVPESVLPPEASRELFFKPETQMGDFPGAEAMGGITPPSAPKSKWWLWILVAIAVIAVGVIGYFAYPLIFGGGTPPPPPAPAPIPTPPPAPPVSPHSSLFTPAPPQHTEVRLDTVAQATAVNAMKAIADANKATLPIGSVQEIVALTTAGSQIPFKTFFSAFAPAFTTDKLGSWFEDDFTSFLFYSANGVFPGWVARVKTGVDLNQVKINLAALEATDLSKFYLSAPGAFKAWKSGTLNGKPTRYAAGTTAGVSFNYMLSGSYLLVSTSFDGLKAAAPLLGL